MSDQVLAALRILGHFWLSEIEVADLDWVAGLPELAETLPPAKAASLDALAVEYQRLFGFNLPPYESVFVDPSAMLLAPATERLQRLYRQGGWTPPAGARAGAPDHAGLELLAMAHWLESGQTALADRLLREHLALWLPVLATTLQRLTPHPFYSTLTELTANLVLSLLPDSSRLDGTDPFPILPPPPRFRASGPEPDFAPNRTRPAAPDETETRLRDVIQPLLPPCDAGLFITREDIARLALALNLPASMGDRFKMLETLFRQAGEFELIPELFSAVQQLLNGTRAGYQTWADAYPAWQRYARAWLKRLAATQSRLAALEEIISEHNQRQ